VPYLSAIAPKIGWPRPHIKFWIAIAMPNVARSQPVSCSIGSWKKPIAERGPKVINAITQPAATISQGISLAAVFVCTVDDIAVSWFENRF
jgi:hypothetical protein